MSKNKTVYVLQNRRGALGIYSSQKELSKGVDFWMKEFPRDILSYEERDINYSPESNCWGWCYIPLNTKKKSLTRGGASFIPMNKYWGFNLVDLDIRGAQTHYERS